MANLNKVMLIGRLTREPEVRTFNNGGKVANFGFAVNNPKLNTQTGKWEDVPVWLDVEAFNRENGRKLADTVMQYLHKGHQAYLEGHLRLDEWVDKNDGSKRSKLKIVLDNLQLLEPRSEGANSEGGGGAGRPYRSPASGPAPASRNATSPSRGGFSSYNEPEPQEPPPDAMGDSDNIPF